MAININIVIIPWKATRHPVFVCNNFCYVCTCAVSPGPVTEPDQTFEAITQLHVGNQHKMWPSGVRSLLLEMHTLRFSVLQARYLEAVFELAQQSDGSNQMQTSIHAYMKSSVILRLQRTTEVCRICSQRILLDADDE